MEVGHQSLEDVSGTRVGTLLVDDMYVFRDVVGRKILHG